MGITCWYEIDQFPKYSSVSRNVLCWHENSMYILKRYEWDLIKMALKW